MFDERRRAFAELKTLAKHLGKTAVGIHFALHCRAAGYDLYHEPNFIPFSAPLPTVVTVHDLSVLLHPEWHPADRVRHHERHFGPAVRRARHVIAVSHQVRRELIDILGVAPEKVTAVPNGVGDEFRKPSEWELLEAKRRLKLPARYFLCVGTVEPRKNLLTVLRAFADLSAKLRRHCPLVLAGPWGWKSEPEREFLTANQDGVISLGYASAGDLPAIYAGASALLYPSHYEGFGLPPVEALACGTRVLASRSCAAVREVLGPYGTFLDSLDVSAWRNELKRIAGDRDDRATTAGMSHARNYTWDAAARATERVYRRVLGLAVPERSTRRAA
jgi:glycosyltransferase involved in cell wall biosynthesis